MSPVLTREGHHLSLRSGPIKAMPMAAFAVCCEVCSFTGISYQRASLGRAQPPPAKPPIQGLNCCLGQGAPVPRDRHGENPGPGHHTLRTACSSQPVIIIITQDLIHPFFFFLNPERYTLWQIRSVIQEDGGDSRKWVSILKLTAWGWLGLYCGQFYFFPQLKRLSASLMSHSGNNPLFNQWK